jgi:hypothetical protein
VRVMIGLNEEAWDVWNKYRTRIRKPYKCGPSVELAQKRLASFGEYQMQVVEQSIERAWTGLFALNKTELQKLEADKAKSISESRQFEDLAIRAQRVRFRQPRNGESPRDYRIDLESAERRFEDAQYRARAATSPKSLRELLMVKS